MKIGFFYGTNTGVTEIVSEQIADVLNEEGFEVEIADIVNSSLDDLNKYDTLIIATPTWNDGELQDDWETVFEDWCQFDFTGKKVGFVGTGDQEAYCDNYLDAVGKMAKPVRENGGTIFGRTSSEGYVHKHSLGQDEDGMWIGLALDNDNQEELTESRIKNWVAQIKKELGV
jgi:flavodoxin I